MSRRVSARVTGGRGRGVAMEFDVENQYCNQSNEYRSHDIYRHRYDFRKGYKWEILQHTLRNFKFLNSALR